jgi:CubicO group peptidase (beta-lactamase class C family)
MLFERIAAALLILLPVACGGAPDDLRGSAAANGTGEIGTTDPASPPIEAAPLDFSAEVENLRASSSLPALAAGAFRGGKLVGFGTAGVRKLGNRTRVTLNDEWHLGSCTKAMTATLIGMLVEEGKLSWDTTLREALPDAMIDSSLQGVTIEMLLQHRGGFEHDVPVVTWPLMWNGAAAGEAPERTRQQVIYDTLSVPAPLLVGTYNYSNVGYMIAGVIIDQRSGGPWEKMIRERLFEPLGMTSCGFGAAAKTAEAVDQPWGHRLDRTALEPVEPGLGADIPASMAPTGSVHCSLPDWAKFLTLHVRGERGEDTLVKAETIKRMHTPPEGEVYADGWNVRERDWAGGLALNHAGSNTLNFASTWLAPEKDLIFVVATNAAPLGVTLTADAAMFPMIERLAE